MPQVSLVHCNTCVQDSLPFHCCLELKKDVVKMFKTTSASQSGMWGSRGSKAQISSVSTLSHHTLSLVPPIVLENLLPYPIIVDVFEGHNSEVRGLCLVLASAHVPSVWSPPKARRHCPRCAVSDVPRCSHRPIPRLTGRAVL